MERIVIINPTAGKNQAIKQIGCDALATHTHITTDVGDAENFAFDMATKFPNAHFVVYGGDGTLSEVANGIMKAGAGICAKLSAKPYGSGNDFLRNFNEPVSMAVDVIKYRSNANSEYNYMLNMVNIGFDCEVSDIACKYKKKRFIPNKFVYPLGIVNRLFHKVGCDMQISYTDLEGQTQEFEECVILSSISSGKCCGGGYFSSPVGIVNDGIMEILVVKKIPRLKMFPLVSKYKKGAHINSQGDVVEEYEGIIKYIKCTKVTIKGMNLAAFDGESKKITELELEIIPSALMFVCE